MEFWYFFRVPHWQKEETFSLIDRTLFFVGTKPDSGRVGPDTRLSGFGPVKHQPDFNWTKLHWISGNWIILFSQTLPSKDSLAERENIYASIIWMDRILNIMDIWLSNPLLSRDKCLQWPDSSTIGPDTRLSGFGPVKHQPDFKGQNYTGYPATG